MTFLVYVYKYILTSLRWKPPPPYKYVPYYFDLQTGNNSVYWSLYVNINN